MTTKNSQETTAEVMTGILVGIVFILFLLGDISSPLAMMAGGIILLGSGYYQTRRGWHVSITTWVLGAVLALGGLGVRIFLVAVLQINWVAIALVLIAAYTHYQFWNGRRKKSAS